MDLKMASEQPVHSPKCSHITGGRVAGAAKTSATLGTKEADSPILAVRNVQYFMKALLETPLLSNLS
jgi:hypothetical protein